MNVMLSQDGKNIITETNLDEAHLLYSALEFISRYKEAHSRMCDEEIQFAEKMAEELHWYLEDAEDEEWEVTNKRI